VRIFLALFFIIIFGRILLSMVGIHI